MKSIIERIIIFDSSGSKREVTLRAGLNIITGDSKTGKSALIEIIDYCLFSSASSIPKGGIIDDFANLYVLILKLEDKFAVIGRPAFKFADRSKAYMSIETSEDFLQNFTYDYFKTLELKPIKGNVQDELEQHLGLSVLDTDSDIAYGKKNGKASLRDFTPFLFQHQNLIANKHALFYRFEDPIKRSRTIEFLPIFLGWSDGKLYYIQKQIEEIKRQIKNEEKFQNQVKIKKEDLIIKLKSLIQIYYTMLGKELEENVSFPKLKEIGSNLPKFEFSNFNQSNTIHEISHLTSILEDLNDKINDIESKLASFEEIDSRNLEYVERMASIALQQEEHNIDEHIACPICEKPNEELSNTLKSIKKSKEKLLSEVMKVGSFTKDNTPLLSSLTKEKQSINKEIKKISTALKQLYSLDKQERASLNLRDAIMVQKGIIETTVKQILGENELAGDKKDLNLLKSELARLQDQLEGYNIDAKYQQSNTFLHETMNRICSKLDFEEDLLPADLHFDLRDFSFYHYHDKNKIHLFEMGSGANWLACHLSLFLSILVLNCKEKKSCIPNFLILDQPSQVYFPNTSQKFYETIKEDENIKQVTNIFNVLISELNYINTNFNFLPQILVLEHADDLKLKEVKFEDLVRRRWSKDGEKLI